MQPTQDNQNKIIKLLKKVTESSKSEFQGSSEQREVVHIRGFLKNVEDINDLQALQQIKSNGGHVDFGFMGDIKDTAMWNPMHFAVYNGHLEVLKVLSEQFHVNLAKTAPRPFASNEGDQVND